MSRLACASMTQVRRLGLSPLQDVTFNGALGEEGRAKHTFAQ